MGMSVSGLGSGFDWQSMVDSLRQVENQRLEQLQTKKTARQAKLSAWQSFAGKLSSMQTAAANLKASTSFNLFKTSLASSSTTVKADSILSATAAGSSAKGSYQVVVNNLATVEKLSSQSYTSQTSDLGMNGSFVVNGRAVNISATDSLQDIRTAINAVNTGDNASGVVASIIQESSNSFKLVLTSEKEGAAGISLLNGSSANTLEALGFNDGGTAIKNQVTGGAQSDRFTSSSTGVETLLGNQAQNLSGSVVINGTTVAIDLSDSLDTIKDNLVAAGISASVVSEKEGTDTFYRLQIEGMSSYTDSNNVLQSLGLVHGTRSEVTGIKSSVANTTDGSTPITASTRITDIYGYLSNNAGDKITISGTSHDGTAVAATDFALDGTKTVGDLLTAIQDAFGNVTASITSDGKIQIADNATGASQLNVNLQTTLTGTNPGKLDFGTFGAPTSIRKYVLQDGQDASFSVDGVAMTSQTNSITIAIPGLTLDLASADPSTTVTVKVDQDAQGIEDQVNKLLSAYNDVLGFVNDQMKYDTDTKKTGGPLFGDNTLKAIKNELQSLTMTKVSETGDIKYLSDIGITIGSDNKLKLDSEVFKEKLAANFDDVVKVFSDIGSSPNNDFQYTYSTRDTKAGTYTIDISQAATGGLNVAGTINGVAASGTSDILRMEDSTNSAYGLQIRYTGTAAPASTTFTFTRGIASLLESKLYDLTDSIDGTLTTQEKSIQDDMKEIDEKIDSTSDQIDRKMALYARQFQAMDSAVSQMKSLQSYLTSQLGSLA